MDIAPAYDPGLHFLGLLCVRGHDWQGTGLSLRYLSTRQCRDCLRGNSRSDRQRLGAPYSDAELATLLGVVATRVRVAAQLWANVADAGPADCWLWQGRTTWGYGSITVRVNGRQKSMRAHRLAFLLSNGFLPPEPQVIRHAVCGNRRCCNPAHLVAGTTQDNVDDRGRHGRTARGPRLHPEWAARGERHGHARWTDDAILEMRRLRASGLTLEAIARSFGTTRTKVHEIVTGRHWKHVGGPLDVGGHPAAGRKLTPEKLAQIRLMSAQGLGPTPIAAAMAVSPQTIKRVLRDQTSGAEPGRTA